MARQSAIKLKDKILNKVSSLDFENYDDQIKDIISGDQFLNDLENMIVESDYSCKRILDLSKPIINKISVSDEPNNWLYYFFQYSLSKSFPRAVDIELDNSLSDTSILYLNILRIINKFQIKYKYNKNKPVYKLDFLNLEEQRKLINASEYKRFLKAFDKNYIYEMMKLSQEITGHNTLEHISGVHELAVHIGRQLYDLNLPIDLGRVSGAAAGHDIGKYGCRKDELNRVAYLHYYYTDCWFKEHKIEYIGHIATNHSTWDLELENLPLESLILIYSDFRVKNQKNENGERHMHVFSLKDSFNIILNKLDNVDAKKEKRYRRVYAKLMDFENFMKDLGVNVNLNHKKHIDANSKDSYALMNDQDVIENIKYFSIDHNINLMFKFRNESSLASIIESARSEKDWKSLRSYLQIFEEYSNYFTKKQKNITINFMYELLTHREEDIRKQAAQIIGILIANYDEEYRKELPKDVTLGISRNNSFSVLKKYLKLFVYPDHKIIDMHKAWIRYSLRVMFKSLFNHCKWNERKKYQSIISNFYKDNLDADANIKFYLLLSIKYFPFEDIIDDSVGYVLEFVYLMLNSDDLKVRLAALERINSFIDRVDENCDFYQKLCSHLKESKAYSEEPVENYLYYKLSKKVKIDDNLLSIYKQNYIKDNAVLSEIYLRNLKSATDWFVKKINIELLTQKILDGSMKDPLHTSMHFCNLIKVSAVENVRNHAGRAILKLADMLPLEQRNDVTIELLRALEIQGYHFTKYIPTYLGKLLLFLHPKELDEIIDDFIEKMKSSSTQIIFLIMRTVGVTIENLPEYINKFKINEKEYNSILMKLLGILLSGLASYDINVKQESFRIIGMRIFGSRELSLEDRNEIFGLIGKKILTLAPKKDDDELLFLNNSAALNHIYRFIANYSFYKEKIKIPSKNKIAFFPGTFDPFTLGHKEIARSIRDLGFEVFLAVDEFSWSKSPQPHLTRQNIINMSIANEPHMYVFPEEHPVNIANDFDLDKLKNLFPKSEVYIVIGSDVILNASSYKKKPTKSSIHNFSHVIFNRVDLSDENSDDEELNQALKNIYGDIKLLSLPTQYEDISSTQIRNNIDDNKDISELIDSLAQKFIYDRGIYRRESQYKTLLNSVSPEIEVVSRVSEELAKELCYEFSDEYQIDMDKFLEFTKKQSPRIILIRDNSNSKILGFCAFHWLRTSGLLKQFGEHEISEYIREHSAGRIIVIDGIFIRHSFKTQNLAQILITETLAFCLAKDYTYTIYHNALTLEDDSFLVETLRLQGFLKIPVQTKQTVYLVNMSNPCTLNLDLDSIIKEPFRRNKNIVKAISKSRKRLQKALTNLYPGQLILSFDRAFLYDALINKICEINEVPNKQLIPRKLGDNMCVPFATILKGSLVPNTVTKFLHTEKMFEPNLKDFKIDAFPNYLCLRDQIRTLKSFNRPVILVDDLLNKGYRLKELDPILKEESIEVKKTVVGILSGRGRELMEIQDRDVESVYFIPNLNVWFTETSLYPFIGGDTVWRGVVPKQNLLPSINFVLPYASPTFIRNTDNQSVFELSKVSLENALYILKTLEAEYQRKNERTLTLKNLGEIFISPRCPDQGKHMNYDMSLKPSQYIKNDLEHLNRISDIVTR